MSCSTYPFFGPPVYHGDTPMEKSFPQVSGPSGG